MLNQQLDTTVHNGWSFFHFDYFEKLMRLSADDNNRVIEISRYFISVFTI